MAQPIQAVQIYFEHPFGAEREVLREFFSFVGCLVKTTMMPVETMLEKHKSLVNPESERITHEYKDKCTQKRLSPQSLVRVHTSNEAYFLCSERSVGETW